LLPGIDNALFDNLRDVIRTVNPFVNMYRQVYHLSTFSQTAFDLHIRADAPGRVYNAPTVGEVAALIPRHSDDGVGSRDIRIHLSGGGIKRLDSDHVAYLPLQYVLLFPFGELGWSSNSYTVNQETRITAQQFYRFLLHIRRGHFHVFLASRLFQQFIVDCYIIIEQNRLKWIRFNQSTLRVETYQGTIAVFNHLNLLFRNL
jgi:hypothetical protein